MSPTHIAAIAAVTAALVTASSSPAEAQFGYPYPPYRIAAYDSSVRIEATPREAEVYVDGYYAGVVDDFDGVFQRLRVEPGQHEIALYHEGYRTHRELVYLARDRTFRINVRMERLAPGETEARPTPTPARPPAGVQPPRPLPRSLPTTGQTSVGRLSVRVQPADAEVTIDGQLWSPSPDEDVIVVDLPEGRHLIQIRKPGYVGYLTEVDVRRGETTPLDVSLRAQP